MYHAGKGQYESQMTLNSKFKSNHIYLCDELQGVPKKVSFLFFCGTEAITDRALKLGPYIKNTWEFC